MRRPSESPFCPCKAIGVARIAVTRSRGSRTIPIASPMAGKALVRSLVGEPTNAIPRGRRSRPVVAGSSVYADARQAD